MPKQDEPVHTFQFRAGETGGYVAFEPWSTGRYWAFRDLKEFAAWTEKTFPEKN